MPETVRILTDPGSASAPDVQYFSFVLLQNLQITVDHAHPSTSCTSKQEDTLQPMKRFQGLYISAINFLSVHICKKLQKRLLLIILRHLKHMLQQLMQHGPHLFARLHPGGNEILALYGKLF